MYMTDTTGATNVNEVLACSWAIDSYIEQTLPSANYICLNKASLFSMQRSSSSGLGLEDILFHTFTSLSTVSLEYCH